MPCRRSLGRFGRWGRGVGLQKVIWRGALWRPFLLGIEWIGTRHGALWCSYVRGGRVEIQRVASVARGIVGNLLFRKYRPARFAGTRSCKEKV